MLLKRILIICGSSWYTRLLLKPAAGLRPFHAVTRRAGLPWPFCSLLNFQWGKGQGV